MKNRKFLGILALSVCISGVMTGCNFFGGDSSEEQVVVETTPTPVPTVAPTATPTIAPDAQDTTYTSADKSISIELPDATWANKSDEADMVSFESPDQGKILILHGSGEEDMSVAVIPSTQDMAVSLEQASDLVEGTDFEIQDYTSQDVSGIGVYSYTVKYTDTTKSGGYAYVVNKVYANDSEFYSIAGSVKADDAAALTKVKTSVDSFKVLGDSTLKSAATGSTSSAAAADGTTTDGTTAAADGTTTDGTTADGTGAAANTSEEALSDTSQTRTIYRNSDGSSLVVYSDGNGGWVDDSGNTYDFQTEEDVYDQDGNDYYYHGEAADVYYMPVGGGDDSSYDESYDESYDDSYDESYDDSQE